MTEKTGYGCDLLVISPHTDDAEIGLHDLPSDLSDMDVFSFSEGESGLRTLKQVEAEYIQWVLGKVGRNRSRAARILGIDRASLWRHLKAREIEVSVLGNDDPQASVCGEVLPGAEFYSYEAKYHDYLQGQIGNPEGEDKPNKKYYDPRKWLREGEVSMIERLKVAFDDLNNIDKN